MQSVQKNNTGHITVSILMMLQNYISNAGNFFKSIFKIKEMYDVHVCIKIVNCALYNSQLGLVIVF